MSQPYSSSGFYMTPVSKALLILGSVVSCCLVLLGPKYQNYFVYSNDYLLAGREPWRLLTCKLAFLEIHSLLLGASLIYHFRVLERRYGSAKFISFLLANSLFSVGVEAATIFALEALEYRVLPQTLCGPQSIVLSMFVPFFMDIPNVSTQTHFLADVVAGKWISYILGVYLTTLTHTTPVAIAYGIMAGILYRLNFLYIKNWVMIPKVMASFSQGLFGWLLSSRPPSEGALPMGATLEIQRQQRMELLEQRMLLAQAQRFRSIHRQNAIRRPIRQTFPLRRNESSSSPHQQNSMRNGEHNGGVNFPPPNGSTPPSTNPPSPSPVPISDQPSTSRSDDSSLHGSHAEEDKIQQLVDMGFNRGAVMQALSMSNNDVTMATTVLLQE
ncbi:ubiquitin-associated domain-containing protein 2-like [Lytechinus variegatus]|uniref:ubiquitin-associated domain-containing protein 2-like n=1 Tax=Lytechinus variegatus TaxID=7654 RepID=UPI001BB20B13|nr:ubiquitin-associated domain-containing protein 2-like [Lytechinus variegatus]